jgi:flagellar basal-body rod protein FlgG
MLRGIYTAGMGMIVQSEKMDVISNNLANVNTNGYKKDGVVFQTFNNILTKRLNDYADSSKGSENVGGMASAPGIGQLYTNYTSGKPMNTGNSKDISIINSNKSFFTIEIPGNSEERYTRDGAFTTDKDGKLVTIQGYTVKGEKGPIIIKDRNFQITSSGEIIQDGKVTDKIKIKTFKDTTSLEKVGDNLVKANETLEEVPFTGTIAQGFLESSNVNAIDEMIGMITVMRSYEASQKIFKTQDEMLGRAVNDIGSLK